MSRRLRGIAVGQKEVLRDVEGAEERRSLFVLLEERTRIGEDAKVRVDVRAAARIAHHEAWQCVRRDVLSSAIEERQDGGEPHGSHRGSVRRDVEQACANASAAVKPSAVKSDRSQKRSRGSARCPSFFDPFDTSSSPPALS